MALLCVVGLHTIDFLSSSVSSERDARLIDANSFLDICVMNGL